ncbi:NAD(P)H-hydrate epimerase [Novosphingobium sp. FSY-8]|uniref:Bifunctional NAD(P)H-hydrate repair enzyme n=1 Tax=Novosphingobium ovatum TaxID=1908523 RepID=A0ABW9XAP0_9SPHN|nr:NAD(P)H-hydrate epimerase [Novosphingobium ovatum]NBC35572.1 NAD(P)H-hydrate epimerase [Novosphingobium ovatum]
MRCGDQILTVAQMRAAEQRLIDGGTSVEALMDTAGRGAAEYVWRVAGPLRRVTVLTGPGNNGGDGWVLAQALHARGAQVAVVVAADPRSAAAMAARAAYGGAVGDGAAAGDVLVDCLYGTGLTRGLSDADLGLLRGLAARHPTRIAIDLPSGVDADTGVPLNEGLPDYALTIALGAWKPAHVLMPAAARMGHLRRVDIGCGAVEGAGQMLARPRFQAPAADAHKYTRGLVAVMAGAMPGAAVLAASAAQGAGAGYVKVLGAVAGVTVPADVVVAPVDVTDARIGALLVGPGLGRDASGHFTLVEAFGSGRPLVVDADALHLLTRRMMPVTVPAIATPHGGELAAMERTLGLSPDASKIDRARNLARASGMVIVAKGADTVIAAPDGRWAAGPRASSWLSVAGTGDVLAGVIAARLAAGVDAFDAACQGVWLHGAAAAETDAPFSALGLAQSVASAYRACL